MIAGLLLLAAAVAAWAPSDRPRARRVRWLAAGRRGEGRRDGGGRVPHTAGTAAVRWRPGLLAAVAGSTTALFLGGWTGAVAGVAAAAGCLALFRRRPPPEPASELLRDLPVACDLLAVCLAAGVPVGSAVGAVASAVPEPLHSHLHRVAGLYRLGAEPSRAWAGTPPALAPLGRALVRAGESGSSVGRALRNLAATTRADQRAGAEAAVRRAGVWVLAPLGACFLPAFLCLGVVPLVLGIASGVFG